MTEIFVVLHNVNSPQRLTDFVALAALMGFKNIVISKPTGSAAQIGVPSAFKTAVQRGVKLAVMPDLRDVIEVFKLDRVYVFLSPEHAEKSFLDEDVATYDRVGLVFGGMEPGITAREAELGERVHIGVPAGVGPIALSAIVLYEVKKRLV